MILGEIKRLMLLERKKERKKLFFKDCFANKNAELSSVRFVNKFDDSINFHSVNFH